MKYICIALIRFYRKFLSPLKRSPCCRFTPSCSAYGLEAFSKRGFFVGLILTISRILRCNPFCAGGYDPVPLKGLRNQKGKRDDIYEYDDGSVGKYKFEFDYDLPLENRDKRSKKRKNNERTNLENE